MHAHLCPSQHRSCQPWKVPRSREEEYLPLNCDVKSLVRNEEREHNLCNQYHGEQYLLQKNFLVLLSETLLTHTHAHTHPRKERKKETTLRSHKDLNLSQWVSLSPFHWRPLQFVFVCFYKTKAYKVYILIFVLVPSRNISILRFQRVPCVIISSFWSLHGIPRYDRMTICLSIHVLMPISLFPFLNSCT